MTVGSRRSAWIWRANAERMPNIGPVELIIVLVIALLVLGPGRLPEVGSAFGKTIREFRKASTDIQEATTIDLRADARPAPARAAAARPAGAVDGDQADFAADAPAERT
jgi:sec-independent protein translocase protein TatA